MERGILPSPLLHLVQEAVEVLFHRHTQRRGAELLPLCFRNVIYRFVVATKSDSVADCIIHVAMLKRPKTFEVTLQR